MEDKTKRTLNSIKGLIALLPLLTVLLFYVNIVSEETIVKILVVLGVTLSTYYGILKLAQPLAEEVEKTGRLV